MAEGIPYQKLYKMRRVGEDGLNIVVSIPPEVVEKEARKRGLTIQQFVEQFRVMAEFNSFEGVHYNFQPIAQEVNNG